MGASWEQDVLHTIDPARDSESSAVDQDPAACDATVRAVFSVLVHQQEIVEHDLGVTFELDQPRTDIATLDVRP